MKTSPKVKRNQLRFYKERETPAILRINGFAIPDNIPAEYPYHATFILRFIFHGVTLLSRLLRPKLNCLGGRHMKPTCNEKAPGTGLGAKSFLYKENGQERRLDRRVEDNSK